MSGKAVVRVPRGSIATLTQFAKLKRADWIALESALLSAAPANSSASLEAAIREAVPSLSESEAESLVGDLFGQTALAATHGWSPSDVAVSLSNDTKLDLTPTQRQTLGKRLSIALTSPVVQGLARAVDVARANEKTLHTARLLTDIRPVFDGPADDA